LIEEKAATPREEVFSALAEGAEGEGGKGGQSACWVMGRKPAVNRRGRKKG